MLAAGLALSLAPLVPGSTIARAESPARSVVTGLARGATGDPVKRLQQALIARGLTLAGGADGVFGEGTESALRRFQTSQGLNATGVVDDATALALGLASSPLFGLSEGDRGAAVQQLQQALSARGIAVPGGIDGVFGPGTTEAVKQFQRSRGFAATGQVNAATAVALGGVSATASPKPPTSKPPTPKPPTPKPPTPKPPTPKPPASNPTATPAPSAGSQAGLVGLKIGARGAAVKRMQEILIGSGFNVVGGADGIFGVLTANALSSFQYSRGITASAVVDAATAKALAEAAAKLGSSSKPPTPATPPAASPLLGLRYGSTGAAVTQLQQALMAAGVAVRGGADGVFGLATRDALVQYQSAKGLPRTGKVDEATAKALAAGGGIHGVGRPSPMVGLKAGSLGASVKQLQEALIKVGVTVRGGADGIFGPATANALKDFQRSQGLPATGVADAATIAALAKPKTPVTTPPPPSTSTGGYAVYGEKGARVAALQAALVKAGIVLRGGVDGDFGSGTSAAVMEFQRRSGLAVTGKVDDATARKLGLATAAAPTAPDPSSVKLKAFPVQGVCFFGDSYGYPRGGGRVHLGVDIIAAEGKLLYAVADGTVSKLYSDYPGSLAGNGLRLSTADGTYFFYAHLSKLADGIGVGSKVKAGQVVGYVGSTGAAGTSHLHFEVHPQGGGAVNPYPLVKAIDGCKNSNPLPQP